MSLVRDVVDRIFFPNRDVHPIPVLDGGFSPNEKLDQARQLGGPFKTPDGLATNDHGTLFVSDGKTVFACSGRDFEMRKPFVEFESNAGGLAWSEATGLLVCVAGHGICALDGSGHIKSWLEEVEGRPIICATAVTIANDGEVFVTDGSQHNTSDQWLDDLMQKRSPTGRLISCDRGLKNARVLADGLEWPSGATISHDNQRILVNEAWPHRLSEYTRAGTRRGVLVKNFTGYPARIVRGADDDYWISFFALRTQLTEFVLREDAFRTRMMANVPPHLWLGPSLGGVFDYREPMQIGRIKKLGIQKPWSPPRSYGLIARLDAEGNAIESFHSRTSGRLHGVTSLALDRNRVVVASKGHGRIVELFGTREADGRSI